MTEETQADITELEDTEGHRRHFHEAVAPAGEPEDTEGHKFHGVVTPEGEPDDTEGHVASHKR